MFLFSQLSAFEGIERMEKVCFFDVDGTLFDTRVDLASTVNATRVELGLDPWPVEAVVKNVGQGARYLLAHSIPETDRPFDELWPIFKGHYAEHCCETLKPYPGVLEVLPELKRRGWLLGVNTNKPNFAVKKILEKFGLTDLFGEAIVAGGDGIALKPDPASLRACAEKLGHVLTPADWMVGDSWTDLKCAESAGIKSAFCSFGFGFQKDSSYTVKIDSFQSLLSFL